MNCLIIALSVVLDDAGAILNHFAKLVAALCLVEQSNCLIDIHLKVQ